MTAACWPNRSRGTAPDGKNTFMINGAPPPELAGWKDTVFIYPQTTVRLAVRFTAHEGAADPYMFHCHMLFHEDQGMMGQFRILAPGRTHAAPAGHDHPGP
ncbi:multicopper oxidase domain-containing protein [Nocardia abscessus]|nr:multicopper oxidase domain-containing protein [Nocardia abscessus]